MDPEELRSRLLLSEQKRLQLKKDLTKKAFEEEVSHWTMVDLMTLLMVFFLFLYVSTVEEPHSSAHEITKRHCLQPAEEPMPSPQLQKVDSMPQKHLQDEKINLTLPPASVVKNKTLNEGIEKLEEDILGVLEKGEQDTFSITNNQHRLVFVLGERITFNVGEADLLESYVPVFLRIADYISSKPGYQVVVSGHTDNIPIKTEKYPSNMELSAARAINVAKFLTDHGVSLDRVSIQGFSEYRPLVENTSPENRQTNRRVEIALIKEDTSKDG